MEDKDIGTINQLLQERERIDATLQTEFMKETTILFTDICGYTEYTERRGDLSSRAMLQRHNDIVLPLIAKHGGEVIKTIGDAVMATFPESLAAVMSASEIQQGLYQYNSNTRIEDGIHVKIGINTGKALLDAGDIFGDAVNVAARIQSAAGNDQILISPQVYDDVRGCEDVLCRLHDNVKVKGKADPIKLYRVVWKDDDVVPDKLVRVRAGSDETLKKHAARPEILHIEVAREGDRIKLCAYEQPPGEATTIQQYEETNVSMDRIKSRCREMVDALNKVNRKGLVSREILTKLKEIGQLLSDELFTRDIKEKLRDSEAEHLIMHLDDQLVHVPWELLYDGRRFLCRKFSMGRLVRTRQAVSKERGRVLGRPLKMLVLADPGGDLKGANIEGAWIRDTMDLNKDLVNTTLRSGDITPDFIKKKIRNFDLIHFAGHSDYDPRNPAESGWRLTGGILKATDVKNMAGSGAMPALIFSNACQSARTEEWGLRESFQEDIFGLANVFLLTGVRHFIGTFWEIMDEPSSRFATEFYKCFMSGMTMGEAVRKARETLIQEFGEENIVWASYLLYGDPSANYMDQIMGYVPPDAPKLPPPDLSGKIQPGETRSQAETLDFSQLEIPPVKSRKWIGAVLAVLLIGAALIWGYFGFFKNDTTEYEQSAIAYLNHGDFDKALAVSRTLADKAPDMALAYLVQGDVYFRKGDLNAAATAFTKALDAKKGGGVERAKALMGLGRIASIQKKTDESLKYYQAAAQAAPESSAPYLAQALLLDGRGDYQKALNLLTKAREYAPKDPGLTALTGEIRQKVDLAGDREKQDRIDQMVKELVDTMKAPPAPVTDDGWSSQPLTLWVTEFSTEGYALQEGKEKLIMSGIQNQLIGHSRARVVERAVLDKLLQELKFGRSELVDKRTMLSLGRILAAKLLLVGKVVYAGPDVHVSMRLIETETGRITAAVNDTFGSAVPASVLAEKLSLKLLEKLKESYPLRGKIETVKGEDVVLNIGQRVGARKGQKFEVVGQNIILEIVSDQAEASISRIVKGNFLLSGGMRVEIFEETAAKP